MPRTFADMRIENSRGTISSVSDWFRHAPPKGKEKHWVDGRSAKELATAWCGSGSVVVPNEVASLFGSHQDFVGLGLTSAEPEARIPFDSLPGEPRNADLAIQGHDAKGAVAISVEAKADEPFGDSLANAWADAVERRLDNARSGGVARIDTLVASLFRPRKSTKLPSLGDIRYQLLTAAAGALAMADEMRAERAVLLVHEFVGPIADSRKLTRNANDLDNFVLRLSLGAIAKVGDGMLVGPITVPGLPLFQSPARLYVGKVSRRAG